MCQPPTENVSLNFTVKILKNKKWHRKLCLFLNKYVKTNLDWIVHLYFMMKRFAIRSTASTHSCLPSKNTTGHIPFITIDLFNCLISLSEILNYCICVCIFYGSSKIKLRWSSRPFIHYYFWRQGYIFIFSHDSSHLLHCQWMQHPSQWFLCTSYLFAW